MGIKVRVDDFMKNTSDRMLALKRAIHVLKKECSGIHREYKRHEFYESPGEKKRRKKRESESNRLKAILAESFTEKKGRSGGVND